MHYCTISQKCKVVKRVIMATNCGKMYVKRTKKIMATHKRWPLKLLFSMNYLLNTRKISSPKA